MLIRDKQPKQGLARRSSSLLLLSGLILLLVFGPLHSHAATSGSLAVDTQSEQTASGSSNCPICFHLQVGVGLTAENVDTGGHLLCLDRTNPPPDGMIAGGLSLSADPRAPPYLP